MRLPPELKLLSKLVFTVLFWCVAILFFCGAMVHFFEQLADHRNCMRSTTTDNEYRLCMSELKTSNRSIRD